MNTMDIYLGAVALCGLSAILIRDTSDPSPGSLSSDGPIKYETMIVSEKKSSRVFVGRILLGIATLSAGIGLLAQVHAL
jgi:hypothetical protein